MSKQPNILFVMTDQQRNDTIHALGNTTIRTPVLDSIVRDGTTFTNCYTPSPVCVAARSATITGTPPHLNGCTSNGASPTHLQSIMQVLQQQGYYTHGIGKMHFNPNVETMWGFDSRDISEEGARYTHKRNDFHEYLDDNGYGHVLEPQGIRSEMYYIPQPSQLPQEHHHTTWVADRAIDFIEQHEKTKPFFLWTSFIKPHPPFESPVPWNKLYRAADMMPSFRPENYEQLLTYWNHFQNRYKYRDKGYDEMLFRTIKALYYASISFIDYNLGRILQALGDTIDDDTLIVFTSDHGELLGDYGSVGKRTMLNPSVNIPLLVKWHSEIDYTPQVDAPVTLLDLFPTFAHAAGSSVHPSNEGANLASIMRGEVDREFVYSQFSERETGLYMIASQHMKYIYSAADRKEWLFDLRKDPSETKNWAHNPSYSETLSRLRNQLVTRFEADNYQSAVTDGHWHTYTSPDFPTHGTDEGLLFQDSPRLDEILDTIKPYRNH